MLPQNLSERGGITQPEKARKVFAFIKKKRGGGKKWGLRGGIHQLYGVAEEVNLPDHMEKKRGSIHLRKQKVDGEKKKVGQQCNSQGGPQQGRPANVRGRKKRLCWKNKERKKNAGVGGGGGVFLQKDIQAVLKEY